MSSNNRKQHILHQGKGTKGFKGQFDQSQHEKISAFDNVGLEQVDDERTEKNKNCTCFINRFQW